MLDSGLLANLLLGLETALQPANLYYCALGVLLGTFLGVIPGIGVLVSISLLFPITFHITPEAALIMLAGIYYGTSYGGNTASILLNLPGTPANAVTCIEGYQMTKSGRAGVALFMTTVGSFVGGSVGIILLIVFSPMIAALAYEFGSPEYFGLTLLGLIAGATISGSGSTLKSLAMVTLGVMLGLVGLDIYTGMPRMTFGSVYLSDGFNLLVIAMGLFGVAEVIASIRAMQGTRINARAITMRSMIPTREDVRRSWMPMVRGSAIGSFLGALPGTGGTLASFMSYSVERNAARYPEQFGKGAIEGVVGPETANNAADQTAFIPTLSLGIPGTATMAIMLTVLILHGITPGPRLMVDQPQLFWGLIMSFWIGNFLLVVLNIPLIGIWVRLLSVPYHLLYPAVLMFVCVGIYSVNRSGFEVFMVVGFGLLGYCMRLLDLSAPSLLLGFVLGPLMEEHFRRSLLISDGDFRTFLATPVSATIMTLVALMLLWRMVSAMRRKLQYPSPEKSAP